MMRRRIDHLAHPLDLGSARPAAIASVGETRERDLEESVPGDAAVRPDDDRRQQRQSSSPAPGYQLPGRRMHRPVTPRGGAVRAEVEPERHVGKGSLDIPGWLPDA